MVVSTLVERRTQREISESEAVEIFKDVAGKYPAHMLMQGVALVARCRKEGIALFSLKELLLKDTAVAEIHKIAQEQRRHTSKYNLDEVRKMVEVIMSWAFDSMSFSQQNVDTLLGECWQNYITERRKNSLEEALQISLKNIIPRFYPNKMGPLLGIY